ncbi:hypothetical protein D3C78_1887220 [compost metagenome]
MRPSAQFFQRYSASSILPLSDVFSAFWKSSRRVRSRDGVMSRPISTTEGPPLASITPLLLTT